MPLRKNVESLQETSACSLSKLLANCIASLAMGIYAQRKKDVSATKSGKDYKKMGSKSSMIAFVVPSKEIQRIKTYHGQHIPKSFRTELFHRVLKSVAEIILAPVTQTSKRKSLKSRFSDKISQLDDGIMYVFNVLICREITELNFTNVLHLTMKWVDGCRLSNMDPKENNINYSQIEAIFLKHFAENTKLMNAVCTLTWPHLISGDLVRIIVRNLQNLRELILACSCEMGPFIEEERKGAGKIGSQEDLVASLRSLFERCPGNFTPNSQNGCPKLKRLILPNIEDEDEKAAVIIANALTVLRHLEVVAGVSTLVSLMKLEDRSRPLSLKTLNDYDPFKQRTMEDVTFLPKILPKLESVELRVSEDLSKRILEFFQNIKELSLEYREFHTLVKNYGSLIYLNISLDFHCPWPLLLALGKYCKFLKHLTLEHSTFRIDLESLEQMRYPKLQNLIYLKLIRSSFIEHAALYNLVRGCCQLTELYITLSNDRNYSVDEFSDQLITAIAPHMKNLEKFTAECLYKFNLYLHLNCILTISSANLLIDNCPKLKFIGHLDSWDVNDKEIRNLSEEIEQNNWSLELA